MHSLQTMIRSQRIVGRRVAALSRSFSDWPAPPPGFVYPGVKKAQEAALGGASSAAAPAAAAPAPSVAAPSFKEVKFVKEDVSDVMNELPEFGFYEIKEPTPNPYAANSLDYSVLLDPVEGKQVVPKMEYSQLENGLKVASIDRNGMSASLGLYVDAGSRFEDASNLGVAHMVSLMAYKSTAHLSHLRTVKVLEQLGCQATATCTSGREEIAYNVNVMREFVPLVVPLLVGNVLFPRLLPWEVKAAAGEVDAATAALQSDSDAYVNELLHQTAYCNNTLGLNGLATNRSKSYFTPDTIREYMLDHFAPERMVLVGVNVGHDELSKWAMRSFVDYNAIPLKDRAAKKSTYTGGSLSVQGDSPFCHVAIAVESPAWGDNTAAINVLRAVLGGANAVDKVPGAGVTSRLGQIVAQNSYIESVSAFNTTYSDSGLFGVYAVVEPDKAADATTQITGALKALQSVGADEVNAAKATLKTSLLREVDDSSKLMADIGTQMLLSGKYVSASDMAAAIDAVDASQVAAAATSVLGSKPTVVAYGDTHAMPHYSTIEAAFN